MVITNVVAGDIIRATKVNELINAANTASGSLQAASNLADVASMTAARINLGLGTAATLNAGTVANEVVQLDGLGKLPAVDGSALVNLPVAGGLKSGFKAGVNINGPFQYITTNVWTKMDMNIIDFDNLGEFDLGLARFTATTNGDYLINLMIRVLMLPVNDQIILSIYKNGIMSSFKVDSLISNKLNYDFTQIYNLVAGDYLEVFIYHNQVSTFILSSGTNQMFFEGYKLS